MAAPDDDVLNGAPPGLGERRWARAMAGEIATDVAAGLASPLATLRDSLALLVDRIDRHISSQTGPTAYPWRSLQAMRQDLAAAYLSTTSMAALASDLSGVVGTLGGAAVDTDVGPQIEAAVNLARHHLAAGTELFVDLGSTPPARVPPGELVLAVARMIAVCARSAAQLERASLSVRTRLEATPARRVVIVVVDNGGGDPPAAAELVIALGALAQRLGGSFDGTSSLGRGSVFELRIPVPPVDSSRSERSP